jgi:mannose/fructose/N-acetylgalactosamine-specific phosphotransferase system component IID
MTNEMQQSETTSTSARRTGRAITVAAAAAGALLLWAVNDPWAGIDLAVRRGATTQHVSPVAVVVTALIAGLAAWTLLALLERTVRRPVLPYWIIASIVLILSLAGPLGSGVDTSSRLVLVGMHLTVGAALIGGLPSRRNYR